MSEGDDVPEGGGEEQATGARTGTPDVFVSYASPNSAAAEAAWEAMERTGVMCWIAAPRDVTSDASYAGQIIYAIEYRQGYRVDIVRDCGAHPARSERGGAQQRAAPCRPRSVFGSSVNTSNPGTRPGSHHFSARSVASVDRLLFGRCRSGQFVNLHHRLVGRRLRTLRIGLIRQRILPRKLRTCFHSRILDALFKFRDPGVRVQIEPRVTHAIGKRDIDDGNAGTSTANLLLDDS